MTAQIMPKYIMKQFLGWHSRKLEVFDGTEIYKYHKMSKTNFF